MAKKLPFNELKVLYSDCKIVGIDNKSAGKREIMGEYHYHDQTIEFDSSLPDTEKANVILHELLHAVVHTMGIKFQGGHEEEEFIVNAFGGGLTTIFRDNPLLLDWLKEVLNGEES